MQTRKGWDPSVAQARWLLDIADRLGCPPEDDFNRKHWRLVQQARTHKPRSDTDTAFLTEIRRLLGYDEDGQF